MLFRITHPKRALVIGDRNNSFFKYGWLTLDLVGPVDYQTNIRTQRLPFQDESIGYLYASHVLEHLDDTDLNRFLKECHRVLKPGGIFRIVVPDFDLFLKSYRENNLSLHFDRPGAHLTAQSIRDGLQATTGVSPDVFLPHNGLLNVVVSFTNGHAPLIVNKDEFEKKLYSGIDNFISWAVGLKPEEEDYGHCNGFNFPRLERFLRLAGFNRVSRGFYGDPFVPKRFSGIDLANKQHISFVCQCIKNSNITNSTVVTRLTHVC